MEVGTYDEELAEEVACVSILRHLTLKIIEQSEDNAAL